MQVSTFPCTGRCRDSIFLQGGAMTFRILFSTAALAAMMSTAMAAEPPMRQRNGLLVDSAGMALYTFDKDKPGTSACYQQCAALWPPLFATEAVKLADGYSVIKRKDGRQQWAWRGKPLYYWLADREPGEASGESVAGWHLVRVDAASVIPQAP